MKGNKMDCVFCKIINKEIPSLIVYEDSKVLCIIPKNMEVYGHTLILPKKHFNDIFDIHNSDLQDIMRIAKKLSIGLRTKLGATGVNILHASGKDAGQSVQHFHLHLFPRFKDDNINAWPQLPKNNFNKEEVLHEITFTDGI